MRRKLVIIAVSVVAAVLIAAASLPWWLGAALGVLGGRFGVTFDDYRRVGYSRFELAGLRIKSGATRVHVSRVELATPLEWLGGRPGVVVVDDWSVEVGASDRPSADAPKGWVELRALLDRVLTPIEQRIPRAVARGGSVAWDGGRIELGATTWEQGVLTVKNLRWLAVVADIEARRDPANDRWTARAVNGAQRWVVNVTSTGPALALDGTWSDQPWVATATFAPAGWLPTEARADAHAWSVPGARVGLGGFYEMVNGGGSVVWRDRALAADVTITAAPTAGAGVPPLRIALHGSGAADRLSVDRLEIAVPGISGVLTQPVVLGRGGRLLSGESRFSLDADLSAQPWVKGEGRVTGLVTVRPGDGDIPVVAATLRSEGAVLAGQAVKRADVAVDAVWPRIGVKSAVIELAGGDVLTLSGNWDAKMRTLTDGRLSAHVSRGTAAHWLPETAEFEKITVEVTAEGAWPAISHAGELNAEALQIAPLKPLSGAVRWKGEGSEVSAFSAELNAAATSLRVSGAADARSVRVDEAVFSQDEAARLHLAKPARITWSPAIKIDPVEFIGGQARLAGEVDWTESGRLSLEAKAARSTWLRDLVELPGPEWTLNAAAVKGSWERGPLVFDATGDATVVLPDGRVAELALSARGDEDGLQLSALNATMGSRPVATISGRAPLSFWPWSDRRVRLEDDGPLQLDAVTSPHAEFWEQLARITGLTITDPDVNLRLAGTMKKPTGEGVLRIGRISPGEAAWAKSLPEVDGAKARVTGDRGGIVLEGFEATVSGQTVRADGRLPIKDWAALAEDPLTLAQADGEVHVAIPDAEVAALARYVPTYLSPAGRLQLDLTLKPGGQLFGTIRLKDAATRPLGPLGILQAIGAEIVFDGRTVEFKNVGARSGGERVTLTGTAALPKDAAPQLDLALKGDNLPFVRQAGLLVRGDLNLRIKTGGDDITRITGATRLRDSLFLMDVRSLLPRGGARNAPGRRPPYFAVELPPFNAWTLDVTVKGDRFLRLRTPVFNGVASANFRLGGTLGDPRLIGEATVNQGQVLLPFASFAVQQGWVRITAADPFEPRVSLMGTGRRYGYDLRMEISGTVDKPELVFTSTPALESEQVLLMVMAGETPQNEISYTGRERAARLGAYLGQSLLGQIGLDPAGQDRLSINIGERISRQGRETYEIEYELAPRWSVVGEYDEFDEYNVGVKWRVFTSKPRPADETKEAGDAK